MKFPDEDNYNEEASYNIDIEFWGVTYINVPTLLNDIGIMEILEESLPINIDKKFSRYNQKIFEIQCQKEKYYIIAGGVLVGINRWQNEDRILNYNLNLQHDQVVIST